MKSHLHSWSACDAVLHGSGSVTATPLCSQSAPPKCVPTSHLHHPHPHSQSQTPVEQDTLRQTSYFLSLRERTRDSLLKPALQHFPFTERCDQHDQLVDPGSFSRSMLGCLYLFISALSFITATGHFHLSRQSNRTGIRAHTYMGIIAALPGRCVSLLRGWDLCRLHSSWDRIPRFMSPCHSRWTEMALCAVLRQTRRPRQENRTHVVLITTYCFFCILPVKQLCAFPSSLSDCQTPTGWNCSGKRPQHAARLTLSAPVRLICALWIVSVFNRVANYLLKWGFYSE